MTCKTDTLIALTERRKQIQALINDNDEKFMQAPFSGAPVHELKSIANQRDEFDQALKDINAEISRVEKALHDEEIRI